MSIRRYQARLCVPVVLMGVLLLSLSAVAQDKDNAQLQRDFTFSAATLTVLDMIGRVEIMPAQGPDFLVTVHVRGQDADPQILKFLEKKGKDPSLMIQFPVEEHREYVYPPLGRDGRTTITYRQDKPRQESWLKNLLGEITGKRVTVRGRGKGLEVWADLTIAVPEGGRLKVVDRVGEITADGVTGDLDLDTSRGDIEVRDHDGGLVADTGSGAVDVTDIKGDVVIDTGSGSVTAGGVNGPRLDIDTGSGSVSVKGIETDKIHVDTGSGSVRVDQASCRKLDVDTGSGGVRADGIAAERVVIDTGSGSVELMLLGMGGGRYEIDTGSGSINLGVPAGASARISAETSSGGVRCHLQGAEIIHQKRNEMEVVIGGGDAQVILDAGSGTITLENH